MERAAFRNARDFALTSPAAVSWEPVCLIPWSAMATARSNWRISLAALISNSHSWRESGLNRIATFNKLWMLFVTRLISVSTEYVSGSIASSCFRASTEAGSVEIWTPLLPWFVPSSSMISRYIWSALTKYSSLSAAWSICNLLACVMYKLASRAFPAKLSGSIAIAVCKCFSARPIAPWSSSGVLFLSTWAARQMCAFKLPTASSGAMLFIKSLAKNSLPAASWARPNWYLRPMSSGSISTSFSANARADSGASGKLVTLKR